MRLAIDSAGAMATGTALTTILVAKFTKGAWLTIVVIPATLIVLRRVHGYYDRLNERLTCREDQPLDLREHAPPLVVIPVRRWDHIAS